MNACKPQQLIIMVYPVSKDEDKPLNIIFKVENPEKSTRKNFRFLFFWLMVITAERNKKKCVRWMTWVGRGPETK